MIVSNEPGYYKTGAYGIRVENLVVVTPCEIPGAEREMLSFETLTLAPIDRSLVEPALLSAGGDRLVRRLPCARARGGGTAGRRRDGALARGGDPPDRGLVARTAGRPASARLSGQRRSCSA